MADYGGIMKYNVTIKSIFPHTTIENTVEIEAESKQQAKDLAIATVPSLGGVWDEPMSAHTIPGSMGKAQNDTNRNSGLIPATV